jgi:hypothetical protein
MQPLTDADLERIFQKYIKGKHHVNCNEFHAHGFDCVTFDDEQTMIIDRLRVEVLVLRGKLDKIAELSKK